MRKESVKQAQEKYLAGFDEMKIRVPKGNRERYKQHAYAQDKSLTALIVELLEKDIAQKGNR